MYKKTMHSDHYSDMYLNQKKFYYLNYEITKRLLKKYSPNKRLTLVAEKKKVLQEVEAA